MTKFETIVLERAANIATVRFNRPERLNAVTNEMKREILEALEALADDSGIQVVILTGEGRAFCAGADLQRYPGARNSASAPRSETRALRMEARCSELLRLMPQVTIAAVNGPCAGAGLSWACAADMRFASRSAVFTTAFLRVGLSGDHGITWLLPRLIGEARARELMLLPRRVDAEEARSIGLVTAVLPDEDLIDHVHGAASELAQRPAAALRSIKANMNESSEAAFLAHLEAESGRQVALRGSDEQQEAMKAFLEKRGSRPDGGAEGAPGHGGGAPSSGGN